MEPNSNQPNAVPPQDDQGDVLQSEPTDYSPPPNPDHPAEPTREELMAQLAQLQETQQKVTAAYGAAIQQNRDLMLALQNRGGAAPSAPVVPEPDPYSVFESPEVAANTEKSVMAVLKKLGYAKKLDSFNPDEFEGVKRNLHEIHRKQTSQALEAQDAREKAELTAAYGTALVEKLHDSVIQSLNADAQRGVSTSYRDGFARAYMTHTMAEKKREAANRQAQDAAARGQRQLHDQGQLHIPRGQGVVGGGSAPDKKYIPREKYGELTLAGKFQEISEWVERGYDIPS